MSRLEALILRIPGPTSVKVAVGTAGIMLFLGATFFGGKSGKAGSGSNAFDVNKPEAVQRNMDAAEEARLSRMLSKSKKDDK